MKQKSIFALVLGAILVLTLSGTEAAFADYDRYNEDRDDDYDSEKDRDDSYEKEYDRNDDDYDSEKDRDDNDDDDKSEREKRRS